MTHAGQDPIYAGALLGYTKASVRNTAAAITETATPQIRRMLMAHLRRAIRLHAKVFHYMMARGLYPAYHPERVIQNDFRSAKMALAMPFVTPHYAIKHKPSAVHPYLPPTMGVYPGVSKVPKVYGPPIYVQTGPTYTWSPKSPDLVNDSAPEDVPYPYDLESDDDRDGDGTSDENESDGGPLRGTADASA
ncbi:MAG: spore coat protein [Alicyclobacillus herbarius]|uniref:spore coat protein n=1 Tax=Alicyclobacillus herbarius TaxID=122960 RepID=UPI002354EA2B|nr:spore coat protein [Alicyclobacillus herbarius]MCL6631805.1 spore coat protein [Alicyclobacillus herbarius]